MPDENEHAGSEISADRHGFSQAKPKAALRNLVIYLLYIGVVVGIGARLGAFGSRLSPPPKTIPMLHPVAPATPPYVPAQIAQLPQGILAFDAELKQSVFHKGDAQGHFVFNLTNISQKPVVIDDVHTSCGCTAAQLPQVPWTLKPRENGQIRVTVNLPPVVEKTTKEITVITPQGVKTLQVETTILPATNSL